MRDRPIPSDATNRQHPPHPRPLRLQSQELAWEPPLVECLRSSRLVSLRAVVVDPFADSLVESLEREGNLGVMLNSRWKNDLLRLFRVRGDVGERVVLAAVYIVVDASGLMTCTF